MAIKIHTVKCPGCGASVSIGPGSSRVTCEYCSTQILISEEKETARNAGPAATSPSQHIGEQLQAAVANLSNPDLRRELNSQALALRDSVTQGMRKPLIAAWIAGTGFLGLTGIILTLIGGSVGHTGFFMCMLAVMAAFGGWTLLFKVLPEKEAQRQMLRSGGIRFPESLDTFLEKPYVVAQSSLNAAGFRNVKCVNLHDVTLGIFQKPGKVESIRVGGHELRSGGGIYMPDVPIEIMYHGK